MKKIITVFTVALLSFGLLAPATPVNTLSNSNAPRVSKSSQKRKASSTIAVNKGAVKLYGDELVTTVYSAKRGNSAISVEYPVKGNAALVASIRNWIDYGGAAAASPAAQIRKQLNSLTKVESFVGNVMEEYVDDIKVIYTDSKVVTLLREGYVYSGGAHPIAWKTGATFSKADGQMLTTDYLPPISSMRPLIMKGFTSWAEANLEGNCAPEDWAFNADELRTAIEYGEPFITSEGLNIVYSPYEIAPYSSGIPQSVIPIASFKNMLPAAASIFF